MGAAIDRQQEGTGKYGVALMMYITELLWNTERSLSPFALSIRGREIST